MAPASAATLRTPTALLGAGLAPKAAGPMLERIAARYAIAIPPALTALIDRADGADPIARQFVPDARELSALPQESADPIDDNLKSPLKGVVHRYSDRLLLKLVSVCAVYCRFCFRREMVGPGGEAMSATDFAAALAYIRARPELWEIILTGGDPLMLSARRLGEISRALAGIDHVKALRWHTRLPVAAPERITPALAKSLVAGHDKAVTVAVHANHARELTPQARAACRRLTRQGVQLISQSVLLRGVNDSVEALDALMRAFVEAGIKPYYLHHPDLAPGTAHFRLPISAGQALMHQLRQRLSGRAMPTYVLDIPGAHGKVPLVGANVETIGQSEYRLRDMYGVAHRYKDC